MVDLYHKIYGEGEPVIIIHGLFGMSDNWASFAKKLSEDRMVIIVDVRDHGRSPHTADFSYALCAEDIAAFMEKNWIYEADVIGHSMGGKVSMQLAYDNPELVKNLVVVDIGPGGYKGGHEQIIQALLSIDISTVSSRKEVQEKLMEDIGELGTVLFLMKNLQRKKEGGFRWKMNLHLLKEKYPEIIGPLDISDIEHNTLFIKGENSNYIEEGQKALIGEIFAQAEIKEIKDASHWVHADQPDALFKNILTFLK